MKKRCNTCNRTFKARNNSTVMCNGCYEDKFDHKLNYLHWKDRPNRKRK